MGRDSTGNRSTEQRSHSQASKGLSGFDSELLREKWELPDLLNPNLRDTPARERVGEHVTLPVWTTLAPHHLTIAPRACTAAAANSGYESTCSWAHGNRPGDGSGRDLVEYAKPGLELAMGWNGMDGKSGE
ncbi:hypothetical protein AXG93_1390s1200 [Marchantia polymorpha subsp. ruderalis]|uniref:Uncharacterized protein n=1 Tax=Marchantia polymorpha subsp. ruderalis TaxID=1480154 RepID=A0A176W7U8_MARPO|nr:hypothetical protein AXG93_1390s1200 [Marchantia polymorpha subsp. ruderalis]